MRGIYPEHIRAMYKSGETTDPELARAIASMRQRNEEAEWAENRNGSWTTAAESQMRDAQTQTDYAYSSNSSWDNFRNGDWEEDNWPAETDQGWNVGSDDNGNRNPGWLEQFDSWTSWIFRRFR